MSLIRLLVAAAVSVLAVVPMISSPAAASTTDMIESAEGPLTSIRVTDTLRCQGRHIEDGVNLFWPQYSATGSCGTYLGVGGQVHGMTTAFQPVSQALTGDGSDSTPYEIQTVVDAAGTDLRVTQTDRYVVGESHWTTTISVANAGAEPADAVVYRGADCYAGGRDSSYGHVLEAVGGVACDPSLEDADDRVQQFLPLTDGANYVHGWYFEVWNHIRSGEPLPDTCRCEEFVDTGAAISWSLEVPAGGSAEVSSITNAGPLLQPSIIHAESIEVASAVLAQTAPEFHATLTVVEGAPITGAAIDFLIDGEVACTSTTDASGVATCPLAPDSGVASLQSGTYTARFAGTDRLLGSQAEAAVGLGVPTHDVPAAGDPRGPR